MLYTIVIHLLWIIPGQFTTTLYKVQFWFNRQGTLSGSTADTELIFTWFHRNQCVDTITWNEVGGVTVYYGVRVLCMHIVIYSHHYRFQSVIGVQQLQWHMCWKSICTNFEIKLKAWTIVWKYHLDHENACEIINRTDWHRVTPKSVSQLILFRNKNILFDHPKMVWKSHFQPRLTYVLLALIKDTKIKHT